MPPILFRDQRFVVLDKPAGLAVHAGPRGGPSVEDWFPALSRRKDGPWLVHRLDADTSGCLIVALRRPALLAAQAEFAAGRAQKTYWAVVRGDPGNKAGVVDAALTRHSAPGGWRMVAGAGEQPAVTEWRVLGSTADTAWLELTPHTGRTHQVRVQPMPCLAARYLAIRFYGGGRDRCICWRGQLRWTWIPRWLPRLLWPTHMQGTTGALRLRGG